jgi:hypothetical protein
VGRVVNVPAHSLELTLAEGHSRRASEAEEVELRSPRGHNTRGYMARTWLHTRKALPTWVHTRKVRPGRARWQENVRGSSEHPIDLAFDIVEGAFTKQLATATAIAISVQHASWKMATSGRRGSSRFRT